MSAVGSSDISSKLGGRTPVRVFFLDNSSKMFLLDKSSLAKDVVRMILEKLDVHDVKDVQPLYSLFVSSNGASIDGALPENTEVSTLLQSWGPETQGKLVFMARLYLGNYVGLQFKDVVAARLDKEEASLSLEEYLENAEIRDAQLLQLQYMQAVYGIISGQYRTTPEEALQLGALQFLAKFGEFKASRHAPGFLGNRIVEFVPARHLRLKTLEEWEEDFTDSLVLTHNHRPQGGLGTTIDPTRRYLNSVLKLDNGNMFGATFFRCTQTQFKSMPSTLLIAIHSGGINILDPPSKELIRQYSLLEMSRWGFKVDVLFYVEISTIGEPEITLEFDTQEGQTIANLLSDYAKEYVNDRNRASDRAQSVGKTPPPVKAKAAVPKAAKISVKKVAYAADDDLPDPPGPTRPPAGGILKTADRKPPDLAPPPPMASPPPPPARKMGASAAVGIAAANALRAKQNKAAVLLQALYRGFALRNEWSQEGAVILIQAIVRGHLQRCRLARMIEEMFASGQLSMM
jgi:hypothetical protein